MNFRVRRGFIPGDTPTVRLDFHTLKSSGLIVLASPVPGEPWEFIFGGRSWQFWTNTSHPYQLSYNSQSYPQQSLFKNECKFLSQPVSFPPLNVRLCARTIVLVFPSHVSAHEVLPKKERWPPNQSVASSPVFFAATTWQPMGSSATPIAMDLNTTVDNGSPFVSKGYGCLPCHGHTKQTTAGLPAPRQCG